MECKEGRNHDKTPGYSCINRNIVECKAVISKLDGINNGRINRNIVECKAMIVYGILWDIEFE